MIKLRKKELPKRFFSSDTLMIKIDSENKGVWIHRFGNDKDVFICFYELKKLYKILKKINKKIDKKIKITI